MLERASIKRDLQAEEQQVAAKKDGIKPLKEVLVKKREKKRTTGQPILWLSDGGSEERVAKSRMKSLLRRSMSVFRPYRGFAFSYEEPGRLLDHDNLQKKPIEIIIDQLSESDDERTESDSEADGEKVLKKPKPLKLV